MHLLTGLNTIIRFNKFHENRLKGLGAVEGRKSPSPIDKAHGLYNSLQVLLYKPWWRFGTVSCFFGGHPACFELV